MKHRSRGVGDPVDCVFSIAALPAAITCGDRSPPNGLPQWVSAMPQYAIAHEGSVVSTPSNPARASGNQNECSSATAWLNASLTAGAHEVSKLTVPTLEPGAALCCACSSPWAHTGGEVASTTHTHAAMLRCFI